MQYLFLLFALLSSLILSACQSSPPAPVIDRAKQSSKPKPAITKTAEATKDWRPDTYTVKKGDTLFAIGLENGLDYKEIAAANNINSPYPIKVGQKLDLTSFKTKTATTTSPKASTSAPLEPADGVVLSPIKTEPAIIATQKGTQTGSAEAAKPAVSAVTPVLSEPKAMRETYSQEAWNRTVAKPNTPQNTTAATAPAKPADAKPAEPANPAVNEQKPSNNAGNNTSDETDAIDWNWPTQGKISAGFNEASNKGIDIAGNTGQAIIAAAPGKVIYSGSDLRGYGKLVIIKHNKTYLSVYAHNSKILVKEGQSISAKQQIAEMGDSDTNSVKLHFEIRRLGKSVDPSKYLNPN